MYILAFILMFVVGSIGAAMKGDFSGTQFIGRVLTFLGTMFLIFCILAGSSSDGSGTVLRVSIGMLVVGIILSLIDNYG